MAAEEQRLRTARTAPPGGCAGEHEACAGVEEGMKAVFQLLGKRWSGVIIAVLLGGEAHFAELRRALPGISERMLSDRLSELAATGLVHREVHEGPPLRVSYRLTEGGRAMEPALRELSAWADAYLGADGSCREQFRS